MAAEQMNFGFHLEPRPEARENQVLDITDVRIGDWYTVVNRTGTRRIRVLTLPHRLEDLPNAEELFMDVEEDASSTHAIYPHVPPTLQTRISLSDVAVMPYKSGKWNPSNYLLK